MESNFSQRVKDVMSFSREEALRLGNDFISVEHLLLGMIREGEGKAINMLKGLKADFKLIRKDLESELSKNTSPNINTKTTYL